MRALTLDAAAAGLRCGTVRVTSDGPVAVTLRGGPTVTVPAGTSSVPVACP